MPDRILTRDLLKGLDSFIAQHDPSLSRADALKMVVQDWLIANGHLRADPDAPSDAQTGQGSSLLGRVVEDHHRRRG